MPNDEILSILKEIRDTQKAHYEQYLAFTTAAMEHQNRNAAALDQTQSAGRAARERSVILQEQTLQSLARARTTALIGAVIQGCLIGAIALLAILALFHRA